MNKRRNIPLFDLHLEEEAVTISKWPDQLITPKISHLHPAFQTAITEGQRAKPFPGLPKPRYKCEIHSSDPDGGTVWSRQGGSGPQPLKCRVVLAPPHHTKVLARSKVAHQVEREPSRQIVNKNGLPRSLCNSLSEIGNFLQPTSWFVFHHGCEYQISHKEGQLSVIRVCTHPWC